MGDEVNKDCTEEQAASGGEDVKSASQQVELTSEESSADATASDATMGDEGDEDDRKLFVGGLPQDARDNEIEKHFSTFGAVDNVNLKTDPSTGRSRGFAFVVFKTRKGLDSAVNASTHCIKGKNVAVKKAQAKQGKVYVGKLRNEISDEEIKEFFASYGTLAAVEQPFDKLKNERKNFCFITFEREEPAKRLLKEGVVSIKGFELEVKKVTPKPDMRTPMGPMPPFGGGRGVMPGARGGWAGGMAAGAAGGWGGYGGDYWGGYGGYGGYGGAPPEAYYGYGGWGGYNGGWGGYGGGGGNYAGGKAPRGRGGPRGRGQSNRGQRQKPYYFLQDVMPTKESWESIDHGSTEKQTTIYNNGCDSYYHDGRKQCSSTDQIHFHPRSFGQSTMPLTSMHSPSSFMWREQECETEDKCGQYYGHYVYTIHVC